eukprot:g1668.t1
MRRSLRAKQISNKENNSKPLTFEEIREENEVALALALSESIAINPNVIIPEFKDKPTLKSAEKKGKKKKRKRKGKTTPRGIGSKVNGKKKSVQGKRRKSTPLKSVFNIKKSDFVSDGDSPLVFLASKENAVLAKNKKLKDKVSPRKRKSLNGSHQSLRSGQKSKKKRVSDLSIKEREQRVFSKWEKEMGKVLERLTRSDEYGHFLNPVPLDDFPGYVESIGGESKLIDFGTMKKKYISHEYQGIGVDGKKYLKWDTFIQDFKQICANATTYFEKTEEGGSPYREANRIFDFGVPYCETVILRCKEDFKKFDVERRRLRMEIENKEPAVQGEWRKHPYECSPFIELEEYRPAPSLGDTESKMVMRKLEADLIGGPVEDSSLKVFFPTNENHNDETNLNDYCLPSSFKPLRTRSKGDLLIEVEMRNTWGIDCYVRKNIDLALQEVSSTAMCLSKMERDVFIESILLPTLNVQTDEDAHDIRVSLRCIAEMSSRNELSLPDKKLQEAVASVLRAVDEWGLPNFAIHPKGMGAVCVKKEGLGAGEYVAEYLGDVYSAGTWAEKEEMEEEERRKISASLGGKTLLPDFWNIRMERYKNDSRGYDILQVDASRAGSFASRMSHSCNPNCFSRVMIDSKGRYTIAMRTLRPIANGEELTQDYHAATESEEEFRAATCLCGSSKCRGSYLAYTGASELNAVLHERHTLSERMAMLLQCVDSEMCHQAAAFTATREAAEADDEAIRDQLARHNLRTSAVGNFPRWLRSWCALATKFVEDEEMELAKRLQVPHLGGSRKDQVILPAMSPRMAEAAARGVREQRDSSILTTADRVRVLLLGNNGNEQNKLQPPLRRLTDSEIAKALWCNASSVGRSTINTLLSTANRFFSNRNEEKGEGRKGEKIVGGGKMDDCNEEKMEGKLLDKKKMKQKGIDKCKMDGSKEENMKHGDEMSGCDSSTSASTARNLIKTVVAREKGPDVLELLKNEVNALLTRAVVTASDARVAIHDLSLLVRKLSVYLGPDATACADMLALWAGTESFFNISTGDAKVNSPEEKSIRRTNWRVVKLLMGWSGQEGVCEHEGVGLLFLPCASKILDFVHDRKEKEVENQASLLDNKKNASTELSLPSEVDIESKSQYCASIREALLEHTTQAVQSFWPDSSDMKKAVFAARRESLAKLEEEKKKRRSHYDLSVPKRPLSAYMRFLAEIRPKRREAFPNLKTTELTTKMAAEWNSLSAKEKVRYETAANVEKDLYLKEKKAFDKKQAKLPKEHRYDYQPSIKEDVDTYIYMFREKINKAKKLKEKVLGMQIEHMIAAGQEKSGEGSMSISIGVANKKDGNVAAKLKKNVENGLNFDCPIPSAWPLNVAKMFGYSPSSVPFYNPNASTLLSEWTNPPKLVGSPALDAAMARGLRRDQYEKLLITIGADIKPDSGCLFDPNDAAMSATLDDSAPGDCVWVQCERPECMKWRRLPPGVTLDAEEDAFWECSMNKWDPKRANCSVPQEEDDPRETTLGYKLESVPDFAVGDKLDVYCLVNKVWYESVVEVVHPVGMKMPIEEVDENNCNKRRKREKKEVSKERMKAARIKVHFLGWRSQFDEWIEDPSNCERVCPRNSRTKVRKMKKICEDSSSDSDMDEEVEEREDSPGGRGGRKSKTMTQTKVKGLQLGMIVRIPPSRLVQGWETVKVLSFDSAEKHPYEVQIVASEVRSHLGKDFVERWDSRDFLGFKKCEDKLIGKK